MVQRVPAVVEVERSVALELGRQLGLQELDLDLTDVAAILSKWIEEKNEYCTPARMIRALVLTRGLGQYVSKLACKNC